MKKLCRLMSILAGFACAGPAAAQLTDTCAIGVYRSPRQEYVSVMSAENGYNYTFFDGRMGNTASPRSRVACADRAVVVMLADSTLEIWPQAHLQMTPTRFASGGDTLAGLLVEPVGTLERPPLVVMSHGSGKEPWVSGGVHWPFTLAGEGVAVFVYDKRGTGQSGGEFTMSLRQLARDLVAASAEARRLAGDRVGRFGLFGMSQG
ncbi:MAG TPA: CocE/NonD family hydrolase, partial [Longimicrobium sp.]|nr:CocE/NonD family hydrolase [Longimicrobium sp.]